MKSLRKRLNKYDFYIIVIILSLCGGWYGNSLQVVRLIGIILLPSLIKVVHGCDDYIKNKRTYMICFLIYCSFSLAWTPDIINGVKCLIYFIIHFAIFFEIICFSRYARNPLKSIAIAWTMAVLFLSPLSFWEILTQKHLSIARDSEVDQRFAREGLVIQRFSTYTTFGNYNTYVTFLCFCFPWISYYFLISRKLYKLLPSLSIIFIYVFILFNASRGGLLALGVMTIVLLLMTRHNKVLFLLTLFLLGAFGYYLATRGDLILSVIIARSADGGITEDGPRFIVWNNCIDIFINSYMLGCGIGGMKESLSKYHYLLSAHNLFLDFLAQFGIVMSYIFFRFIYNLFRKSRKLLNIERKSIIYMVFAGLPFYSIINSEYIYEPQCFVFLSCICVFVEYERISRDYRKNYTKLVI